MITMRTSFGYIQIKLSGNCIVKLLSYYVVLDKILEEAKYIAKTPAWAAAWADVFDGEYPSLWQFLRRVAGRQDPSSNVLS